MQYSVIRHQKFSSPNTPGTLITLAKKELLNIPWDRSISHLFPLYLFPYIQIMRLQASLNAYYSTPKGIEHDNSICMLVR